MGKTALCLAGIAAILLFTAPLLHAVERSIVFNTESMEFREGTGAERCKERCARRSGADVGALLSEGWKIVGSAPHKVVAEGYWFTPCSSCQPHGCTCIGTEYRLERDTPAAKAEPRQESRAGEAKGRSALHEANIEAAGELDLLRREIESLKRENGALRREIEELKKRPASR